MTTTTTRRRQEFAALFSGLSDPVLLVTPNATVVAVNAAAERLVGQIEPGTRLLDAADTDLEPHLRTATRTSSPVYAAATMGDPPVRWRLESWRAALDGPPLVVVRLRQHRDAVAPFAALTTKVSELAAEVRRRQQAEERLTETVEELSAVFGQAPVGIVVADRDPDGTLVVQRANAALADLVGRDEATLLDAPLLDLVDAVHHQRLQDAVARLTDDEQRMPAVQVRLRHAGGEEVWAAVSLSLLGGAGRDRDRQLIAQMVDLTERRRFEANLRYLADHDPVTGLFNRRRFEDEVRRELDRMRRYGGEASLLLIDLDGFKRINDTLGHTVGDDVIRHVAQVIAHRLRTTDVVGRLGGDEFAVLLPGTGVSQATHVAEDLRRAVRGQALETDDGIRVSTTATVGLTAVRPDRAAVDTQALLVEADLAMYEAKDRGGDRVSAATASPAVESRIRSEHRWTQRLHDALDNERLRLYAQPILDLANDRVRRYELLVRMDNGRGGVEPAAAFLPVAERVGMIRDVDRWVVRQSVRLLADWQDAGCTDTVEVNLSGSSITDPDVIGFIEHQIRDAAIDATRLVFEITETAAIADVALARRSVERLSALGCRFALDDFGAGFGSFHYLKHLPSSCLKIDGDFVRDITSNTADQLTVKAIVQIARGLGKETIAEFVGDTATLEFVRALGVDFAQGFHIGRPEPVERCLADVRT